MVNGFWVHLSLVTAKAGLLEMPEELKRVLLDPNLVRHVSCRRTLMLVSEAHANFSIQIFWPHWQCSGRLLEVFQSSDLPSVTVMTTCLPGPKGLLKVHQLGPPVFGRLHR